MLFIAVILVFIFSVVMSLALIGALNLPLADKDGYIWLHDIAAVLIFFLMPVVVSLGCKITIG